MKNSSIPRLFVVGALTAPFSLSLIAQEVTVAASNANSADEISGIEVIEVSAQKRITTLQETPIAISAFNSMMLQDQDIEDALDIQYAVPNLIVSRNTGFSVRGVGNNAVSATADPGLGVHINGVYLTANTIQNEYYDLASVEVLRGPQGTLYGRNTTAGVLNTLTRRPEDVFEASLTTDISNFNGLRTTGYVNLPITDSVLQRFAFNTVKRDGYTDNIAPNVGFDSVDGRDQWSVRSTTAFQFSDNASGMLFAQYFKEHSDRSVRVGNLCTADPILGCSEDSLGNDYPNTSFTDGSLANGALRDLFLALGFGTRPDFYNTNLDGTVRTNPSNPRQIRTDYQPSFNADDLLVSFEFNYDWGNYVFTSVTAYHDRSSQAFSDFDFADGADALFVPQSLLLPEGRTEPTTRYSTARSDQASSKQWSQELRVASFLDGPLNYTAGLFYMDYDAESFGAFYLPELTAIAAFKALPDDLASFRFDTPELTTKSWAIFGEAYYDFTEKLQMTVGLRYTEDEKSVVTRAISPLTLYPFTPGSFLTTEFDLDSTFRDGDGEWEEVTGKLGLSYQADIDFTQETLLFGTLSRGYKGGGINPGASDSSFPTFDPEYITAFELGTKNTFAERTLQANLTAFFYRYDGLQVGGILGDGTTFNTNVDADVKGAELELLAMPIDGLRVNLNVALLDSEITEDFLTVPNIASPVGSPPVNIKGSPLVYSPDASVQLGAQYVQALNANWEVLYRVQTFWQDEYQTSLYNEPNDLVDSWHQTDASITLRDTDDIWAVEAYVKNASDEASLTGLAVQNSLVGRYRVPNYLEPRIYGVRLTYRFE